MDEQITVEQVEASNARRTGTGVERGVDVDVRVRLSDGRVLTGEVTLVPDRGGSRAYRACGDEVGTWISSSLLDGAGGLWRTLKGEARCGGFDAIEAAAGREALATLGRP